MTFFDSIGITEKPRILFEACVKGGRVGRKMAKKAKKRFSRAISIKKCSKLLEILARIYSFSLRIEWRKRQIYATLRC